MIYQYKKLESLITEIFIFSEKFIELRNKIINIKRIAFLQ
jgi:hypothetical protein